MTEPANRFNSSNLSAYKSKYFEPSNNSFLKSFLAQMPLLEYLIRQQFVQIQ